MIIASFLTLFYRFLYDSPLHYRRKLQDDLAAKALEMYHDQDAENIELSSTSVKTKTMSVKMLLTRQYIKPFLILNVLFLLMLFSGKFVIEMFAVEILEELVTDGVDENIATILLGKDLKIMIVDNLIFQDLFTLLDHSCSYH